MVMTTMCSVCRSKNTILTKGPLNIYRCNICTHEFTFVLKDRQEDYGKDYFLTEHRNWFNNPDTGLFDLIYRELLKLSHPEKIRLLDVGCGNGTFLKYLLAKGVITKLYGIDLADNGHPDIRFIKGDFLKEAIEGRFKAISSIVSIEHIDEPHLFIEKINKFLEPRGLIFIMTINSSGLIYKLARILNKIGMKVLYERLYSSHHINHYSNKSLKTLMEMHDFEILLHKNHNYSIKSVDVPKANFFIEGMYKFLVWIVFLVSSVFGCEYLQTIVCRKKG